MKIDQWWPADAIAELKAENVRLRAVLAAVSEERDRALKAIDRFMADYRLLYPSSAVSVVEEPNGR